MSRSGRETLPDVREWSRDLPGFPFWIPGGHPGYLVEGRLAHPDIREWSGGPPGCSGLVGRPCQMSGSG